MPRKSYSSRELIRVLKAHDDRFEIYEDRAKGSERMIFHPDVEGRPESYPIRCHGEGDEVRVGHILAIRRRFKLPTGLL